MTWWKQAAERWLLPVVLLVAVGGCGGESPTASAPPSAQSKSVPPPEAVVPIPPKLGLIPLPSAKEVQQAAPGGRNDPFGRLSDADQEEHTPGVQLSDADGTNPGAGFTPQVTGVLMVGNQKRAMVTTSSGSGVICVGADGRCAKDAPLLLPTGWSVVNIDVARGCIQMELNGEPQDFCIA